MREFLKLVPILLAHAKFGTDAVDSYLDSTIHLAYLLLRMLERWAKTQGQMYVRKSKKAKKKSRKGWSLLAQSRGALLMKLFAHRQGRRRRRDC